VLVENDSSDKTVSTFLSWGHQFNASSPGTQTSAQLISFIGSFQKKAINGLAIARNKYLNAFASANTPQEIYDYLIAVDTDMCVAWEVDRISQVINDLLPLNSRHSKDQNQRWDVLLGRQRERDALCILSDRPLLLIPYDSLCSEWCLWLVHCWCCEGKRSGPK
jgi:hypothetical protein